ncbi:HAD hydrolase-like protein [Chloroflexota bacterium]
MFLNVLFDLDGTLTDPKEGFVNCIQYALRQLGQSSQNEEYIASLIGPPLHSTFVTLLHSDESELIGEAIRLYRQRYSETGIFESEIYPGITELLDLLHRNSYQLWVLTFKPKIWIEKIIKHFSYEQWFSGVFGPTLDERLSDKVELVKSAIAGAKMIPADTVIIGDRKEDIIAGNINGILTVGVTYGYGTREEIIDAEPNYICDSPDDIRQVIMDH